LERWLQWSIALPPIPVQRRIAAVLDTWDEAIAIVEGLFAANKKRHRGLIGNLASHGNFRRQELLTFAKRVPAKITLDGSTAVSIELDDVESKTGRLLGTTDTRGLTGQRSAFKAGDTLFGKLRPYLRKFLYAESDGLASTEFWVLRPDQDKCRSRFLYYLVQTDIFAAEANRPTGSRMPRAEWELVGEAPLPLPPLQEQDRLLDLLIASEQSVRGHQLTADLLRCQKRGLMQKLLTGAWRVPESVDHLFPGAFRKPQLAEVAAE
jgi:type I restriction enzyme S subunit